MLFDDYNKKNSDVAQENPAGINGGSVTAQSAYDSLLGGIAAGKERIGNAIKHSLWHKPYLRHCATPNKAEYKSQKVTHYSQPLSFAPRRTVIVNV